MMKFLLLDTAYSAALEARKFRVTITTKSDN